MVWGGLNGLYVVASTAAVGERPARRSPGRRSARCARSSRSTRCSITWVFFRAASLSDAATIFERTVRAAAAAARGCCGSACRIPDILLAIATIAVLVVVEIADEGGRCGTVFAHAPGRAPLGGVLRAARSARRPGHLESEAVRLHAILTRTQRVQRTRAFLRRAPRRFVARRASSLVSSALYAGAEWLVYQPCGSQSLLHGPDRAAGRIRPRDPRRVARRGVRLRRHEPPARGDDRIAHPEPLGRRRRELS